MSEEPLEAAFGSGNAEVLGVRRGPWITKSRPLGGPFPSPPALPTRRHTPGTPAPPNLLIPAWQPL